MQARLSPAGHTQLSHARTAPQARRMGLPRAARLLLPLALLLAAAAWRTVAETTPAGQAAPAHSACRGDTLCLGSSCHDSAAFDRQACPDCRCLDVDRAARIPTRLCRVVGPRNSSRDGASASTYARLPYPDLVYADWTEETEEEDGRPSQGASTDAGGKPKPCRTASSLLRDGAYVVRCLDCADPATCDTTTLRYTPRGCKLLDSVDGPINPPPLPPKSTIIFFGDSTIRGHYEILLQMYNLPSVPFAARHANHSAMLPNNIFVAYRYYPPWHAIRNEPAASATFPSFKDRYPHAPELRSKPIDSKKWTPGALDFLWQITPMLQERQRTAGGPVLFIHGGIMLRTTWVDEVQVYMANKHLGGRVQHMFVSNGPRDTRECGQYMEAGAIVASIAAGVKRGDETARAVSALTSDPMGQYVLQGPREFLWLDRCDLMAPLYPVLVRGDKCQCHWHWEIGHSGRQAGPAVVEMLRVMLHAWRLNVLPRGLGTRPRPQLRFNEELSPQ